jgi:hypothetical protein
MPARPPARNRKRSRRLTPEERERLDRLATNRRKYRARLSSGGASLKGVPIKNLNALIAVLSDLRWLPEEKSEDRKALVEAVGALLDDLAKAHCR